MNIRHHYMTLCFRDNIEVAHKFNDDHILEIEFERAVNGGFDHLLLSQDLKILDNNGFNDADVQFCKDFTARNIEVIMDEAKGAL